MPLFSIVVPTYNSGKLIDETITSLINQDFKDYEIIIIDDGSTDGTFERLQKYKKYIQIFGETNKGSTYARNIGIESASGEYIVSFDHDDILLPFALKIYSEVINYFNHPPLIFSSIKTFERKLEESSYFWGEKKIEVTKFKNFFKKNISLPVINGNIIARRENILKVSGYQQNSFAYDDHLLLFRLGTESPMISINHPITVGYRNHIGNWSRNIEYTMKGALAFINSERKNKFPGGISYRLDRRGLIGSNLLSIFKDYLGLRNLNRVLKIFFSARTMILLAFIRKFVSYFYKSNKYTIELMKY
jgi:glycosyltransferase involved in cell wall biosynthesis